MTTPWSRSHTPSIPALLGAIALSALSGCATIANANYARQMDEAGNLARNPETAAGLVVSGEEDRDYSSRYVGIVLVTFENRTNRWLRVKGMALGFGGGEKDATVTVPMGQDLESWAKAAEQLARIHRRNRGVALSVLAVAGGVTAAAAGKKPLGMAGAAVAAGSLAVLAGDALDRGVKSAESPYYDDHLLSVPFSIAPGLFTKKWVALSTTGGARAPCIDAMLLDYELDDGRKERVWLPFRKRYTSSDWQDDTCGRRAKYSW